MKTLILSLIFNILIVVHSLDPPTENKETRNTAKEKYNFPILILIITHTPTLHKDPEIHFNSEKESSYFFSCSVTTVWSLHQSSLQF